MSSTEEYLDSLLKAAMDNEERNAVGLDESKSMSGVMDVPNLLNTEKESEDSDGEMTQEEFAAMLASVDEQLMETEEYDEDLFMTEADITETNITETNMTETNMTETNLVEANMVEADMVEANMVEAGTIEAENEQALFETNESLEPVDDISDEFEMMTGGVDENVMPETDELLADMALEDDDLAEINDLLKKSESEDFSEDDMLAMLEEASSQNSESDSLITEEFATEDVFDLLGEFEAESASEEETNDEAIAELLKEETELSGKDKKKKEKKNKKEKKAKKDKGEKRSFFKSRKKKSAEADEAESVSDEFLQNELGIEGSLDINTDDDLSELLGQFGDNDIVGLTDEIDHDGQSGETDTDFFIGEEAEFIQIDIPDKAESKNKPKGFMGRVWEWLTEEDEEEPEEQPKKEKKDKKDKKNKKDKKGKNTKQASENEKNENEEIMDEMESEDAKDGKKKKKKEKVKKPKKVKNVSDENKENEKKLPIKMVIRIFVLCFSVLALIILVNNVLFSFNSLKQARKAYYDKNFQLAYENLVGKDLNESDTLILEKATLILQLQRKYDSYYNYLNIGMQDKALNALLNGYELYKADYEKAVSYGITEDYDLIAKLITDALQNTYGITIEKAEEFILMEDASEYRNAIEQQIENLEVTP